MSVVRQIPKVSEKKNNNALKQALAKRVDYFKDYYVEDNVLYVRLDASKIDEFSEVVYPRLPAYHDIEYSAKQIYKKFKRDDISKICYMFGYIMFNGTVNISPYYCDVKFISCQIRNLNVFGGDSIEIIDTGNGSICFNYFEIECKDLKLKNVKVREYGRIGIISEELTIENSVLNSLNNIDLTSSIMVFNDSKLEGQNIDLKCDLIDTKNSIFKSEFQFNIKCRYNEEVNGIQANRIIYNGKDITNSAPILKFKLLRNLLEDLKKVKDMVTDDIEKDIEETTRIRRETLEEKSITKILNKNNR